MPPPGKQFFLELQKMYILPSQSNPNFIVLICTFCVTAVIEKICNYVHTTKRFSSQLEINFNIILCHNLTTFIVWPQKEANLKFSDMILINFLTWSFSIYLFWITRALLHFELSHYGLNVMIIVHISHCALLECQWTWA